MSYYICWTTRNGQRLWEGPYRKHADAQHALTRIIDGKDGFVTMRAVEW